jgi:hypothetical protein
MIALGKCPYLAPFTRSSEILIYTRRTTEVDGETLPSRAVSLPEPAGCAGAAPRAGHGVATAPGPSPLASPSS